MYSIETINYWVALGAVGMQLAALVLLVIFLLRKRFTDLEDIAALTAKWGLWAGFLLTSSGLVMSLFYSEVLGLTPCGWCWVMRIFMYSQVVLFAVALWKRDRGIADYSIALSVLGLAVGLYQHYLQMGGTSALPCPATASEALDCAVRFLFEFGYVTFPLVGSSLFAFLIIVMLFVRKRV
ncbi:disulfide bond formation protein B [Candidatus Kaiserbacteria bacterium]|nr:disulfide bond formation protein B [Candidatus Kaiserbacteria bacterium]